MLWLTKRTLLTAALIAAVFIISSVDTELDISKLTRISNMFRFIRDSWLPPDWSSAPETLRTTLVTLEIAFLGSFTALCVSLPLSFMAARNLAPAWLVGIVRWALSFLRAVPEIVFGLIFVTVVGLGPFPAILAIMLHNIGVLGKLLSELAEASDPGPQEALRSTGASRPFIAMYAVFPAMIPHILSNFFYRLEVAIRASLILGFIGAGGVGQQLFLHFKLFEYEKVAVDVLVIMALVVSVDWISAKLRKLVI
ncbi:phosphonate ABC transporter, permease protein PhnE [Paenibacillus turpanensis]|uniref:phosphonate ABC transporter, permease protein PhnE n=1 Tax=Paenibacillus turpanensis TaxID=2689078 RepID=UPI00140BF3C8|nr:phosphonate ABC transporter, permease protein PhnE [Paenibacillus turpanensis]